MKFVFVTGNANTLKEMQEIVGDDVHVESRDIDCECSLFNVL